MPRAPHKQIAQEQVIHGVLAQTLATALRERVLLHAETMCARDRKLQPHVRVTAEQPQQAPAQILPHTARRKRHAQEAHFTGVQEIANAIAVRQDVRPRVLHQLQAAAALRLLVLIQ